jgi:hypothetical protein
MFTLAEVPKVFPGAVERLIVFLFPKTELLGQLVVLGQFVAVPIKDR